MTTPPDPRDVLILRSDVVSLVEWACSTDGSMDAVYVNARESAKQFILAALENMPDRTPRPESRDGEKDAVRLFDSQWVNVVNHDNCYRDWSKEDAIAHAVKMTEQYMRENFTNGFPKERP